MKTFNCKHCGKEFITENRSDIGKFIYHQKFCEKNPDRQKNIDSRKRGSITMNRKVNQRNHENRINMESTRRPRTFNCKRCNKEYVLNLTDHEYEKFIEPNSKSKLSRYCSPYCAHVRNISENTKKSISDKLRSKPHKINKKQKERKQRKYKVKICKECNKEYTKGLKRFCSVECKNKFHSRPKVISEETRRKLSVAGRHSAATMNELRRSKNEILFCKMCEDKFGNVGHNVPMFNGWDADVLLYDYKIAVHWNGKWHYVSVIEKGHSTLKSIQNRDKIKHSEIDKAGWIQYNIKDMGKFNKNFVNQEFVKFVSFVENLRSLETVSDEAHRDVVQ